MCLLAGGPPHSRWLRCWRARSRALSQFLRRCRRPQAPTPVRRSSTSTGTVSSRSWIPRAVRLSSGIAQLAGWKDADLGDVNADGDLEIVAIGEDGGNVKVAVFDPVITSGAVDPNKKIPPVDGIPWDTLYEVSLVGSAEIVLSDNFDDGIPGDELLYAYQDIAGVSRVVVMNAASLDANGKPTGRDWKTHVEFVDAESGRTWRFGRGGDINGKGSAEAVLVDSKSSKTRFDVFDVDQGFLRVDGKNSDGDTIRKVAVGQIIAGGGNEIAEIRTTKPGSDALKVYKWVTEDGELNTDEAWAFSPQPESVFLADLDGNGDKEVLFLRKNPDEDGSRLIMVDKWGDDQKQQIDIEISLDDIEGGKDNEFKLGAGGDLDGDGRDEIIIASSSRIVVFRDPHASVAANTRTEYLRDTNNDTLLVGDLDSVPYSQDPVFGTDKSRIEASVPIGTTSSGHRFQLTDVSTGENVNFSVVQPLPDWLTVTPLAGVTPATLNLTFDATQVPVGVRLHTLQVTSNAAVVNKPISIDVKMTVEPAAVTLNPQTANFVYYPCTPPVDQPMNMVVDVGGNSGLNYAAVILKVPEIGAAGAGPLSGTITGGEIDESGAIILYDSTGGSAIFPPTVGQPEVSASSMITWPHEVEWITAATGVTYTVPSTVSLTVNPAVLSDTFDVELALMVFVADTRAGTPPDNVDILPITMMCAQDRVLAPSLMR